MFQTLLVVVGVFGWARTRKSAYLYTAAVGFGLMLATKVVFYIVAFIVVSFVGMVFAAERFRPFEYSIKDILRDVGGDAGRSPRAWSSASASRCTRRFLPISRGCARRWWRPHSGPAQVSRECCSTGRPSRA